VYGNTSIGKLQESTSFDPQTNYSYTKMICEGIIAKSGIPFTTLRLFNVVGAGCFHKPERYLIPRAIRSAITQETELKVYGSLDDMRDYVSVQDVARAFQLSVDNNATNCAVNIGCGKGIKLGYIINKVKNACGQFPLLSFVGGDDEYPECLIADNTRARKMIEWEPSKKTVDEMIYETVKYWKEING
jgi:UDP-glucose 4-epimerase